MPELIMVCGPNGAGKSTFTRILAARRNLVCVDPDALSTSGLSPVAAGKAALRLTYDLLSQRVSFIRESTLTAKLDFRIMQEARSYGYTIQLIYIKLSDCEMALCRVRSRVEKGGHDVPAEDVMRRFRRSLDNLPKALDLVDSYMIFDNTGKKYRLIEKSGEERGK
ncbi:MAG: zeta toxin family protein [Mailhella sp.]|nr:zeta toxin family protein [Mailhella sp.]